MCFSLSFSMRPLHKNELLKKYQKNNFDFRRFIFGEATGDGGGADRCRRAGGGAD